LIPARGQGEIRALGSALAAQAEIHDVSLIAMHLPRAPGDRTQVPNRRFRGANTAP
jgi:hypothetical protein